MNLELRLWVSFGVEVAADDAEPGSVTASPIPAEPVAFGMRHTG